MYDVKVYSLAAEGAKQITPHFKVREFACSDGSDVVFVAPSLVDILENVRVHFGAAVHIHSGYRTVSFNASLPGSSKKSQHCNGLAPTSMWTATPTRKSTTTPASCWAITAAWACTAGASTSTSGPPSPVSTTGPNEEERWKRYSHP